MIEVTDENLYKYSLHAAHMSEPYFYVTWDVGVGIIFNVKTLSKTQRLPPSRKQEYG